MNARMIERELQRVDDLHHPVVIWSQFAIAMIGCLFWALAQMRDDAFSADVFGNFALQFPAEAWAVVMGGASLMVWLGLQRPPRRWMIAVGSAIQAAQYIALGYSAIATGGEVVIGAHCTIVFAPFFGWICWKAVGLDHHT